ncbi:GIY-YIG nuclease family protein [Ensifer adhaerens]|uniref:GIY-YIG nuclease family protein n=1 Tax=Ensifer adhaerens TaxID=106592 RepID=UPI001C4E027A|nr:GIY-YIG nuclease family protein [Ensifer adhaerens]MBW0368276.1 GIY-YIG nuclease family protein [Ensifer adhaerens]UCM24982.1 GIY-YIG nuclease family protein [Ensifer adhaerens]
MPESFEPSPYLGRFGIASGDPGYIYVLRSQSRLKVGRSTGKSDRLRQARTWIPDAEVLGIKPFWNHRDVEKYLQLGLSMFWYKGEWYDFKGDEFEGWFLDEFVAFDDVDINRNSINFIYFMNSSGMSEYTLEFSQQGVSKARFQRDESAHCRGGDE